MFDQVVVVRAKTYLESLIERFNSKSQAKFYLERLGRNFAEIENEHDTFYEALEKVKKTFVNFEKHKIIDRSLLPNIIFSKKDLIIGLGQDGLIANIAKYANGQPILGFNPNPEIYDGFLLPFNNISDKLIKRILVGEFTTRKVVMAKATFSDGQELLAFNDFFIGTRTHTSARYTINFSDKSESQSSSGIIVSTGIGSTGWMSSICNMVCGISGKKVNLNVRPTEKTLVFAVREPFKSKTSNSTICFGKINTEKQLTIVSQMVENGIVFSDGIEADFISFNIGMAVEIGVAENRANLIIK